MSKNLKKSPRKKESKKIKEKGHQKQKLQENPTSFTFNVVENQTQSKFSL